MKKLITLIAVVFVCSSRSASTQVEGDPPPRKWDVAVSAGVFQASPAASSQSAYGDDWYTTGRLGVAVGRYWTSHLKTEFELAAAGEGSRYVQRFAQLPQGANGMTRFPYSAQELHRLTQGSARLVWQFFDNQWIHPYVFAGMSLDANRQRSIVSEQYHYVGGDYRNPGARVVIAEPRVEGPHTVFRTGAVLGAGSKLYVAPQAFANTAALISRARGLTTVSFALGFGFDF